jgi:hypothetical protein
MDMSTSVFGQFTSFLQDYFQDILYQGIESQSENNISFVVQSEVGFLGYELELLEDEDSLALVVSLWPLIAEADKIYPYDLCITNMQGYEVLDDLHRDLRWGKLELWGKDKGCKHAVLTRCDMFERDTDTDTINFNSVVEVLEMLMEEALRITPILAKLSIGETLDESSLSFALQQSVGMLQ